MPREKDKEMEMWRVCERGGKRKKEEEVFENAGKWRGCSYFAYFATSSSKGYILCTTHLGMRVKVEEFLLLFSHNPLNSVC